MHRRYRPHHSGVDDPGEQTQRPSGAGTSQHPGGTDRLPRPGRARHDPATPDGPLFVSVHGAGYHRSTVEGYFARLVTGADLQPRGAARPRLHDLRHTFATAHMAAAYRHRGDPQRTLTLLATWLGHTSTAHTYWYLFGLGMVLPLMQVVSGNDYSTGYLRVIHEALGAPDRQQFVVLLAGAMVLAFALKAVLGARLHWTTLGIVY